VWYKEECAKSAADQLLDGIETGAMIANAYEEPMTQAIDAWCPEEGCFDSIF